MPVIVSNGFRAMSDQKTETRGRKKVYSNLNGRIDIKIPIETKEEWIRKARENGYTSMTKWISHLVETA